MTMLRRPVQDFIRKVGEDCYSFGDKHLLSQTTRPSGCAWSADGDTFFCIAEAEAAVVQQRISQSDDTTHEFPVAHEAGKNSRHIVWKVGNAFIKLVIPHSPDATPEHVTLRGVESMLPDEIKTPHVLFHGEWDGRYCLAVSEVPGLVLHEAWPFMGEESRSKCVRDVTGLCSALAKFHGQSNEAYEASHRWGRMHP